MGAGASVDETSAEALAAAEVELQGELASAEAAAKQLSNVASETGTEALASAGDVAESSGVTAAAGVVGDGVADATNVGEAAVADAIAAVPDAQKQEAIAIFEKCKDSMTPEQMSAAASDMKETLANLADSDAGHSVVVVVGAEITTATACAPGVIAVVSEGLLDIATHLPYVGVAAGVLGGIIVAFRGTSRFRKIIRTCPCT